MCGSKQLQISEETMSIEAKDAEERKHEMEVEIEKFVRKLSVQLRLLTERNKLHTTKKAWHKLQQRRMPEGLQEPKAISKGRPRGHPVGASRI